MILSPACTWRLVAWSAGTMPTIAAASTLSAPERQPERELGGDCQRGAGCLTESELGDRDSRQRRHGGQHQRFDKELGNDAAAASAQCGAYGDFRLPRGRARIHEYGDVETDQHEHQ
jgi:hypothetical protein